MILKIIPSSKQINVFKVIFKNFTSLCFDLGPYISFASRVNNSIIKLFSNVKTKSCVSTRLEKRSFITEKNTQLTEVSI